MENDDRAQTQATDVAPVEPGAAEARQANREAVIGRVISGAEILAADAARDSEETVHGAESAVEAVAEKVEEAIEAVAAEVEKVWDKNLQAWVDKPAA